MTIVLPSPILPAPPVHAVLGTQIGGPFDSDFETLYLGMGCFWGAERLAWQVPGVYCTAVGYMGGKREHPSYEQVSSGTTGHFEAVAVTFPAQDSAGEFNVDLARRIMRMFWECHDPTSSNRQGNDVGTQYRSALLFESDWVGVLAEESRGKAQSALPVSGGNLTGSVLTTQVERAGNFFLAEEYHQQYLFHNPQGYCMHGPTGLRCDI